MPADSSRDAGHRRAGRPAAARLMAGVAAALVMAGCGSAPDVTGSHGTPGGVTVVRDDAKGTTVRLRVGARLELILSSSYWNVHGSSAPAVLRQGGPPRLLPRPSTCPQIPGLGCTPIRTWFTARAPGTAMITANRISCGEALMCRPDQRRFSVTVVVR